MTFNNNNNELNKKSRGLLNLLYGHLYKYPSPMNLNYLWSFGFLTASFLAIQILTGIVLSFHYTANTEEAFISVERLMREVNYGSFIRYTHSNGASFFFICMYIHMVKALIYRSYKDGKAVVWYSGMIIYLLSMATAFVGYVLPWGQMSFWGAVVITNFFSAIPLVGESISFWIWGGYGVNNSTLQRFFIVHFLLPFIISILFYFHLSLLHKIGSSNLLNSGGVPDSEKINFYPYFLSKDIFALSLVLAFFFFIVGYYPNTLMHPDNYIPANPLVTPNHIVPEWYFLMFYAILRCIPNKALGVLLMVLAILSFALLPLLDRSKILVNSRSNILWYILVFVFLVTVCMLFWLGAKPVDQPYLILSQVFTFMYFFCFVLIFFFSKLENFIFVKLLKKKDKKDKDDKK